MLDSRAAQQPDYPSVGEPIEQMSDATEEATHGQLVLSQYAYHELSLVGDDRSRIVGSELESKQFLLEEVRGRGVGVGVRVNS